MKLRAFKVEYFGFQQALSVAGTQIKLTDNVRFIASGGVHIRYVLRNFKREVAISTRAPLLGIC